MTDIISIIKSALPKSGAKHAEAVYSHGINRKSEAIVAILREHRRGPGSQRLKEEVLKLAQAQKDARPAAAPKPAGAKVKARLGRPLATASRQSLGKR